MFEERVVRGSLSDALWDEVVAELRHTIGASVGQEAARAAGRSREWHFEGAKGGETRATLSERGDRLHLRLTSRAGRAESAFRAYGLYGVAAALLYGLIAAGASTSAFVGVAAFANALVLAAAALFVVERTSQKRVRRRLGAVAERIGRLVEQADVGAAGLPDGSQQAARPPRPALDLDDAPEAEAATAPARNRARA